METYELGPLPNADKFGVWNPEHLSFDPLLPFWYWVNERHKIFFRRHCGAQPPWTTDQVLANNRFTNVFRDLDRGTRWFIRNIAMRNDLDERQYLLNTSLYRTFNKIETAEALELPWKKWNIAKFRVLFEKIEHPFTGAHMSPAFSCGTIPAHFDSVNRKIPALLRHFREDFSVENAYNVIRAYVPGAGPFYAHQFCQDLRHTPILGGAPDGETWSVAGPGCLRGLMWCRLYGDPLSELQRVYETQDNYRDSSIPRLEVKDIQQSMCELQKYLKLRRELCQGVRCKRRKFDSKEAYFRPLL